MKAAFGAIIGLVCFGMFVWAVVAFISSDALWPISLLQMNDVGGLFLRTIAAVPLLVGAVWSMATGADFMTES